MHSPEYTKSIKALLQARETLTLNMNSAVYQFRNGRQAYPEHIEAMKKAFNEALSILESTQKEQD